MIDEKIYWDAALAGVLAGPPLPEPLTVEGLVTYSAAQPAFRAAVESAFSDGYEAGRESAVATS